MLERWALYCYLFEENDRRKLHCVRPSQPSASLHYFLDVGLFLYSTPLSPRPVCCCRPCVDSYVLFICISLVLLTYGQRMQALDAVSFFHSSPRSGEGTSCDDAFQSLALGQQTGSFSESFLRSRAPGMPLSSISSRRPLKLTARM